MAKTRFRLSRALPSLAMAAAVVAPMPPAMSLLAASPVAQAASNPCAPCGTRDMKTPANPCAPVGTQGANKPANPCAPAGTRDQKKADNPCAPAGAQGKKSGNPCAPAAD